MAGERGNCCARRGSAVAYHNSANWSDWTDLIYANGKLLAKSDTFEDRIHTHGTNCSNCGSQYSIFTFPSAAGLNGHVIASGDKLFLRQYQGTGAHGGMIIKFSDGSNTSWAAGANDQDGNNLNNDGSQNTWHYRRIDLNNDGSQNTWHYRRIDLSSFTGKTINEVDLVTESSTGAGNWDLYYTDIAFVEANGTVYPIYNRGTSISLSASGTSGVTGRMSEINHISSETQYPDQTTVFYHADHVGSSRLMSSVNGYPIWQGTYLPFGYEYNPQTTVNIYKFQGYEHDSESGLENADLRMLSSQLARFTSPDPLSGTTANPQTLNKYAFTANNPLKFVDPTGAFMYAPADDNSGGGGSLLGADPGFDGLFDIMADIYSEADAFLNSVGVSMSEDAGYVMSATMTCNGSLTSCSTGGIQGESYADGDYIYNNAGQQIGTMPSITPATDAISSTLTFGLASAGLGLLDGTGAATAVDPATTSLAPGTQLPGSPDFVVTPTGQAVPIPDGWTGSIAQDGNGLVYQEPGATGNQSMIRIADPNSQNPTGYVRIYNSTGQPVTASGNSGHSC